MGGQGAQRPSTDPHLDLGFRRLLGSVFLVAIALAFLRLLPIGFIPEKHSAVPDISTAVTAHKSYEEASKPPARKIHSSHHAGLWTARNTKRIADEIGNVEKLERPERAIEVNASVRVAAMGWPRPKARARVWVRFPRVSTWGWGITLRLGRLKAFRQGLGRGEQPRTFGVYAQWVEETRGRSVGGDGRVF